jgi:3-oxoacyl-[acyl-carrier protein] reductase
LIAEGAKVVLCARNEVRLNQVKKEIGAHGAYACDLSQPGTGKTLVQKVLNEFGRLDILVTNTGGPPKGNFMDLDSNQWQAGFQGLFLSVTESMEAAIPIMKKNKWGRILLVTSVAAKEAMPKLTVSNGLRAGLLGLVKTVSNEVAADGITINSILPGYTDTERLRDLGIPAEKINAQVPAGRMGKSSELGSLAAFLASDHAAYITGQAIAVDGGYLRGI